MDTRCGYSAAERDSKEQVKGGKVDSKDAGVGCRWEWTFSYMDR